MYTAVIHQPHFLPWLGYYNKLSNADLYITQDNVQFRKRYFQNRTLLQSPQKEPIWFTVPVNINRNILIKDVLIADKYWNIKFINFIKHSYSRSKYYKDTYLFVEELIMNSTYSYLLDLNINLTKSISEYLKIDFDFEQTLHYKKQSSPTDDLVYICLLNEVNRYIFGEGGGMKYHGTATFKKNNILTVQQQFYNKFHDINKNIYPASDKMSVLHYLFLIGKEETERIIKNTWTIS